MFLNRIIVYLVIKEKCTGMVRKQIIDTCEATSCKEISKYGGHKVSTCHSLYPTPYPCLNNVGI